MTTPDPLLNEIATLWQRLDPPPAGLARDLAAAVDAARASEPDVQAPDDLDIELLTLVARHDALALGVRAGAHAGALEPLVLEFTGRDRQVLLRLSPGRIDGWVAPPSPGSVHLHGTGAGTAPVDGGGRFVLDHVPAGMASLLFDLELGPSLRARHRTPGFQV